MGIKGRVASSAEVEVFGVEDVLWKGPKAPFLLEPTYLRGFLILANNIRQKGSNNLS